MKKHQLNEMLQQVQQLQAGMLEVQEELANTTVEGSAGGGVVTAVVTGSGELRSVTIDPSVVDPADVEMLQDLVVAAVHDATRKARELQSERWDRVTGGLDLGSLGGGLSD